MNCGQSNADFQSAVSQFFKLQGHDKAWGFRMGCRAGNGHYADYKSAVQPIANLRYAPLAPGQFHAAKTKLTKYIEQPGKMLHQNRKSRPKAAGPIDCGKTMAVPDGGG
jgi:hypothetical protein